MQLVTINTEDFLKVLRVANGSLDGIVLEWEENETASQNLFKDKKTYKYLRRGNRSQTTETGIGFQMQLFDRFDDNWRDLAERKFERYLGIARIISTEEEELELFRMWVEEDATEVETGLPSGEQVHLEYVEKTDA